MDQRIYANTGAASYSREGIYINKSIVETQRNRKKQEPAKSEHIRTQKQSSGSPAGGRCYRVTVVLLVLLCVLLLSATIVLWIKFNILAAENNQLQASNKKLVIIDTEVKLGWIYFSSSFYYISYGQRSWNESREDCRDRGADLVIINSTEEQKFLIKVLGRGEAWIGLTAKYNGKERAWNWVDGTKLTNGYWNAGEPNNLNGSENCVVIWAYEKRQDWNDKSCSERGSGICEKSAF